MRPSRNPGKPFKLPGETRFYKASRLCSPRPMVLQYRSAEALGEKEWSLPAASGAGARRRQRRVRDGIRSPRTWVSTAVRQCHVHGGGGVKQGAAGTRGLSRRQRCERGSCVCGFKVAEAVGAWKKEQVGGGRGQGRERCYRAEGGPCEGRATTTGRRLEPTLWRLFIRGLPRSIALRKHNLCLLAEDLRLKCGDSIVIWNGTIIDENNMQILIIVTQARHYLA